MKNNPRSGKIQTNGNTIRKIPSVVAHAATLNPHVTILFPGYQANAHAETARTFRSLFQPKNALFMTAETSASCARKVETFISQVRKNRSHQARLTSLETIRYLVI